MRQVGRVAVLAAGALGLVVAMGVPGGAATAKPTVSKGVVTGRGAVLVESRGRTLYLFTPESGGKVACTGPCAATWPPLLKAGPVTLAKGIPGKLTTVKRPDGKQQIAYNGIPLYRYAGDTKKGTARGQGIGGVWFVVKPGAKLAAASATTTTAAPQASTTTTAPASSSGGGSTGGGTPSPTPTTAPSGGDGGYTYTY